MALMLRQSTAVDVLIGPFLDETNATDSEEGESPVVLLSKNGQALAAKNDATTPVHDDGGYYNCELDATDTNTVGTLVLIVEDSANALPVRHEFQVVEEATYDFLYASGATPIADVADQVLDEPLSGHQVQGSAGAAITMAGYAGPRGPGVYIDDGAANTDTVDGEDGTLENPVSTIAAATTIAASLGIQRFYLVNNTEITLAQTYEDYEFVGIGLSNQVDVGSQDVDNTQFRDVTLTGTQGGSQFMGAFNCRLQAILSAEIIAINCQHTGAVTMRAGANQTFIACTSAVPGGGTPDLIFPGSGTTTVNFRHYSGGLTVKSATVNDVMSYEADGQLIIDATCTSLTIVVRGNCKVTDNGTTTSLDDEAVINRTNINAEADAALSDYDPPTYAEMNAEHVILNSALSVIDAIVDAIVIDTADIQGRLPAGLVSGRIDAYVGAMASPVISSVTFFDNAITSGKIADGAITSAKFAGSALTAIADALLKRDMSAVSGEAARSLLNALRFLRNKWRISGGVLSVKKENDSDEAWSATVQQASANPVNEIDPA